MKRQSSSFLRKIVLIAFCAVQFVVWMVLLFAPMEMQTHNVLSYSATVFCLAVTLFFFQKKVGWGLQVAAFVCTLFADFFLVLLSGEQKTLAMCAFLCAQLCYAWRTVRMATPKEQWLNVVLRLVCSVVGAVAVVAVLQENTQPLFVISLVYYVNLLVNIVFSFVHWKDGVEAKYMAVGLLCFSLCDLSIGLNFVINIFSLGPGSFLYGLKPIFNKFVGIFYPPSQALLCVSAYSCKR